MKEIHYRTMGEHFSTISPTYDTLNQVLSFGIDIYWRSILVSNVLSTLNTAGVVLDLATGTYDVARALVKKSDATVLAVDLALGMLCSGIQKIAEFPSIIPVQADAHYIPISNASVDAVTISFGIRNMNPRSKVFSELFRVLKPGKCLFILEFANPSNVLFMVRPFYNTYLRYILPAVSSFFNAEKSMYQYLAKSIEEFPNPNVLVDELYSVGFSSVTYKPLSCGIVTLYTAHIA